MEWHKLLSVEKLMDEEPDDESWKQYPINEFEKDYNKIVSCAAFRRLQDKTQVFPLDKSDFVRTRLTHSIEVSTIARQLGIMISKNTTSYKLDDIKPNEAEGIASVLLCAGLLHDIGNPPFGHFGETTIREWFRNNLCDIEYKGKKIKELFINDKQSIQMLCDLENFEGNAQAFRILAKAQYKSEINLSAAIVSTMVKYPTDSISFNNDDPDIIKHKNGYFFAEYETLKRISGMVGTFINNKINRHPLTYLLEAADDIAYVTADIEDAFKKNLFSINDFIIFFESRIKVGNGEHDRYSQQLIDNLKERKHDRNYKDEYQIFKEWSTYVRRWLMYSAVFGFSYSYNYKKIMNGEYENNLFYNTYNEMTINIMKHDIMRKFVYNTQNILKLELSSQTILNFLLTKFINAIIYYDSEEGIYKLTESNKKIIKIIPDNFIRDYNNAKNHDEINKLYLRLLIITDYISGMTDSYARTLYRELSGIE